MRPNQYDRVYEIVSNNICDLTEYDTATYEGLYNKHIHNGTNFVPIMRGCNNFCTYCIVPYTRGREKSRNADDIINEINLIYKKGGLDITLLGQNVNSYDYKGLDFPALLNRIVKETDIPRIRFLTSHPKDLSDKLIDTIFSAKRICKSLHLPVQSGSDRILTKMNRGYKISRYKGVINRIRNVDKEFVITTDIIVGFPGETEEDYNMTLELVNDIRYDFAYMFRYSPRVGTPAAKFKDQIPEEIKLNRLNKLIDIQNSISYDKNREMIGKTYEVFFEGISKRNSKELSGRTDGNKIVVYNGEYSRTAKVVIKSIRGHTPFGLKI
ncbi:MAG: MiaB/RimO family radical SAM methylthiotransferase [Proteobacteria bacterium]|nr:MiaB/RimO family radical SAM methylthiotransferase [Pseudomonadota bacterium]